MGNSRATLRAATAPPSVLEIQTNLPGRRGTKGSPMKIGITCYPTYGGSGVVATELGKGLAKRGHQIHFISYAMPMRLDGFMNNIYYHEVEMATYPLFEFPLYTPALASKMVEVANFQKLDLIHAHYAIPHATSAYIAKQDPERRASAHHHHIAWHRHYANWAGAEFSFGHEVQH